MIVQNNGGNKIFCKNLSNAFSDGFFVNDIGVRLAGLIERRLPIRDVRWNFSVHTMVGVVEGGAAIREGEGGIERVSIGRERSEMFGERAHSPVDSWEVVVVDPSH